MDFAITKDKDTGQLNLWFNRAADIADHFKRMGSSTRVLSGIERLSLLQGIMRPNEEMSFAHAWVLGILPASQLNATVRAAFMPDFTLELLPIFSSQKRVEMSILSGFLHSLQWFGPQKLPRYFQA